MGLKYKTKRKGEHTDLEPEQNRNSSTKNNSFLLRRNKNYFRKEIQTDIEVRGKMT
jgi:hypothetical protein